MTLVTLRLTLHQSQVIIYPITRVQTTLYMIMNVHCYSVFIRFLCIMQCEGMMCDVINGHMTG